MKTHGMLMTTARFLIVKYVWIVRYKNQFQGYPLIKLGRNTMTRRKLNRARALESDHGLGFSVIGLVFQHVVYELMIDRLSVRFAAVSAGVANNRNAADHDSAPRYMMNIAKPCTVLCGRNLKMLGHAPTKKSAVVSKSAHLMDLARREISPSRRDENWFN